MLAAASALALSGVAWAQAPPGWTTTLDPTGRCAYAVPPDWTIEEPEGLVRPTTASPDGRLRTMVQWVSAQPAGFVNGIRAQLHPFAIHENTPRRFWAEYASAWSGTHHVVITPADHGSCAFYIDLVGDGPPRFDDLARKIIGTVMPAR